MQNTYMYFLLTKGQAAVPAECHPDALIAGLGLPKNRPKADILLARFRRGLDNKKLNTVGLKMFKIFLRSLTAKNKSTNKQTTPPKMYLKQKAANCD